MISHNQLGSDEDLAREVLVVARDIAPCLDFFEADSENQKDALAILKRVYAAIAGRGPLYVKGQRIGSASVEYAEISSEFDGHPRRALRALCGASTASGMPVGSFPAPSKAISGMWPEETR